MTNLDSAAIHTDQIHQHALDLGCTGQLSFASFGQNPTTGIDLNSKIDHFKVGDTAGTKAFVESLAGEKHRNTYTHLATFTGLRPGAKGGDQDIEKVFGFCADFDDPDAHKWGDRVPLPPNMVFETSPGNFQCFFILDRGLIFNEAKEIALQLTQFTGCDKMSQVPSMVWRIPGLLNWPNKKKLNKGRSPIPFVVQVVQSWDENPTRVEDLRRALSTTVVPKNSGPVPTVDITKIGGNGSKIDPEKLETLFEIDHRSKATFYGNRPDLGSASQCDQALAYYSARLEWTDDEIANLIFDFRKRNGHDTKKALRPDYLRMTISKARESAGKAGNHNHKATASTPLKPDVNSTEKPMTAGVSVSETFTRESPETAGSVSATVGAELIDPNPCGAFDTAVLPPALRNFADDRCQHTDAESILIVQSIICSLSGLVGKRAYIKEGQYFQKLYPNIWALTISHSGSFKSTAQRKGSPLIYDAQDKFHDQSGQIRSDLAKALLLKIKKDRDAEVKRLNAELDRLSKSCPMFPNRLTAEALLQHLVDYNGGVLNISEFGEWLGNMNRSFNEGMKPLLTDLYDVPSSWSYRTKGAGLLVVERPFIALNAVSTLPWVEKNIDPTDVSAGFFARFLIFNPPETPTIPPALPLIKATNQAPEMEIKRVLNAAFPTGAKPREYVIAPSAQKTFVNFHTRIYSDLEKQSQRTKEILAPYCRRWSPYILKIATLFQPFFDPKTTKISTEAVEAAYSVVDYAIKSTVHLFKNELGETPQQRKQRLVLQYLQKCGGEVKRSRLQSSRVLDGGSMEYDHVLDTLDAAGKIKIEKAARKADYVYKLI